MSQTEHNKGVLRPVKLEGDVENKARLILQVMGQKEEDYYDTYREQLEDVGYRSYYITDTDIYTIENQEIDPDHGIAIATKNEDGTISFETKFYNGGCSFNEALDSALKKLEN